jgi:hypothetical protein
MSVAELKKEYCKDCSLKDTIAKSECLSWFHIDAGINAKGEKYAVANCYIKSKEQENVSK